MLKFIAISLLFLLVVNCKKHTPITGSKIVFTGDFETNDFSQWEGVNKNMDEPESYQIEIVTSPVREGMYAVKTVVHSGDEFLDTGGERCDLERRKPYEQEGDDFWYAWSTLFPEDWQSFEYTAPNDWLVIADWHSQYSDVGQLIQLELDAQNQLIVKGLMGKISSYTDFEGNGKAHYFEEIVTEEITLGKWNDFVFHVYWTTEKKGIIEFWHKVEDETNYTKILDIKDKPTLQFKSIKSNYKPPYFILAHYRDDSFTHTTTLYHDGFRQGTTQASIEGEDGLYVVE